MRAEEDQNGNLQGKKIQGTSSNLEDMMQFNQHPSQLLAPSFDHEDNLSRSSNQAFNDSSLYQEDAHTEKTLNVTKQEHYNAFFEE